MTAAVIALVWLPTLLRAIALTGGNLKTPAGDASTTGLLRYFSALPPDQQEESLAAAAAEAHQPEVTGTPDEQSNARQVREELEEAIGEIPRPAADVARRLNEIATEYENLRAEMTSGGERTRAMTELMARARGLAASRLRRGDPSADPHRWYRTDSEGGRSSLSQPFRRVKTRATFPSPSTQSRTLEVPSNSFTRFGPLSNSCPD